MNLLDALGLESILDTNLVKQIPVDLRLLPENITKPFAFSIETVALLAVFIGCNSIVWQGNIPHFLGPSVLLCLTDERPLYYFGHFERRSLHSVYYTQLPNYLTVATIAARGGLLYQREILSLEPEYAREISHLRISRQFESLKISNQFRVYVRLLVVCRPFAYSEVSLV